MSLLLPYPPSANRYYRNFRGRMVRSALANEYRSEVEARAIEARMHLTDGPVRVCVTLLPPRPADWERRSRRDERWALSVRRIDLDNALKVTLDALQGVAYHSDRQITSLRVNLGEPVPDGGLRVEVAADEVWADRRVDAV
jgi:crossover junction endodeoxyribonuclease RusA